MDPLLASASVVFGLIFGSFLNVCIYRLPRDLSVLNPHWSVCPECKKPIAFYDNIPFISWLLLRGRCRQCKAPISPRYLMVEVLTAVLFFACSCYFGATLATIKYCLLAFLLLGLIFTVFGLNGFPCSLRRPASARAAAILRRLMRLPVLGLARWRRFAKATASGRSSPSGLRPSHFPF